jgi:hypothetical protein
MYSGRRWWGISKKSKIFFFHPNSGEKPEVVETSAGFEHLYMHLPSR